MLYAWFMRFFIYYTITFSIENLSNDISINIRFLGLAEILAALLSGNFYITFIIIFIKTHNIIKKCMQFFSN